MRNIGMTGGIGCGKSKVAEFFESLGFYTIDSDITSRKVMEINEPAYNQIVSYFGEDILDKDKNIIRKKLGNIVFNNKEKLKVLENIVHPAIYEYERKKRAEIYGRDSKAVIITHAALMIESGSYKNYDAVIIVTCNKDVQINRVMQRDNISMLDAEKIISCQMNQSERLKYADFIIDNSSNIDDLKKEVKRVYNLISEINYGEKHN